jgi:hypothetical protein
MKEIFYAQYTFFDSLAFMDPANSHSTECYIFITDPIIETIYSLDNENVVK